jgi:DNA-binding transcriptional LysR family regulator
MAAPALNGVELRHLRALHALARAGSFHAAAATLGYTQSAVSQQIAALERSVGQRLVHRSGGRNMVALTEAGESLLVHAEAIFARLDAAMEELRSLADGLSGRVRVGCFQTMARHVVPGLVRRMSRRSPHVELHLRESDCDLELQRQVACGDLDIAFVVTPVSEDWLTTLELMEDGPVAVVCDGDPYADRKTLDIRDLRARNIATFAISPYQSALEHALQVDGSRPRITVRTEDNDVLIAIARSGDSLALMTDLSARGFLVDGVRAVPVRAAPARGIALAWNARATPSPGMAAVVEEAVSVCAEVEREPILS